MLKFPARCYACRCGDGLCINDDCGERCNCHTGMVSVCKEVEKKISKLIGGISKKIAKMISVCEVVQAIECAGSVGASPCYLSCSACSGAGEAVCSTWAAVVAPLQMAAGARLRTQSQVSYKLNCAMVSGMTVPHVVQMRTFITVDAVCVCMPPCVQPAARHTLHKHNHVQIHNQFHIHSFKTCSASIP